MSRTSRTQETRVAETAVREYRPASSLPDPLPEPGFVFRWVAAKVLGQDDLPNMSRKERDGWVPVRAEDHPELMLRGRDASGNVEVGGLILCKMAQEQSTAIAAYYERVNGNQISSVDNNYMREQSHAHMPMFKERSSQTTRGSSFGAGVA